MARITVEDCLDNVDNRFELVLVGSRRARQLMMGHKESLLPWESDKATVVALREVEQGLIDASILEDDGREDLFETSFAQEARPASVLEEKPSTNDDFSDMDMNQLAALLQGSMTSPVIDEGTAAPSGDSEES